MRKRHIYVMRKFSVLKSFVRNNLLLGSLEPKIFFPPGATAPSGQGPLRYRGFSITLTRHTQ